MYTLTVEDNFSSAHQLRGYKGKCENIHGHNWKVALTVRGDKLNDIGLLVDFHEIKKILKEVLSIIDHKLINDVEPFNEINPSSENLARFIFDGVKAIIDKSYEGVETYAVRVWESATSSCTYMAD